LSRFFRAFALAVSLVPIAAFAQDARYIVKFKDSSWRGQALAALQAHGGRIALPLDAIQAFAAHLPAPAVEALSRLPFIEYVEEDPIREPYAASNRALPGGEILPWGIQMVQADLVVSSNEAGK
jgi:hypothetical protein